MKLYLVLRLFREWHAKTGVETTTKSGKKPHGKLIHLNADRLQPALKNVAEYLRSTGKIPITRMGEVLKRAGDDWEVAAEQAANAYWCEIETDTPASEWLKMREVEAVIEKGEFDKFALSIRCMSGTRYVEACERYAQSVETSIKDAVRYEPPGQTSKVAC